MNSIKNEKKFKPTTLKRSYRKTRTRKLELIVEVKGVEEEPAEEVKGVEEEPTEGLIGEELIEEGEEEKES